jgi:hypothetical protein
VPLASFPPATPPRGRRLRHEIAAALALKAVLLAALYVLFFSAPHRPPADAAATRAAVIEAHSGGAAH